MWRHNDVIGWNEYLISIWPESAIPYVYSLQFLCKSTHHSWRYGWKCEWVFFLNTVYLLAFMKELVFQVWKSCFHLPMAILYTIHPRTLLMSPMHSLSLKMWILIYYMPYFRHFGSSYMCYCVDGGHIGRHLEFNPFCPVIQTVHPSFFTYLGVHYEDQESKWGDIRLHTGPPSAPGLKMARRVNENDNDIVQYITCDFIFEYVGFIDWAWFNICTNTM